MARAPKKPSPAAAYEQAIIDNAVMFTAFVQRAPGDRVRAEGATLGAMQDIAASWATDLGKPIMIYAVNAAGRTALVEVIQPRQKAKA